MKMPPSRIKNPQKNLLDSTASPTFGNKNSPSRAIRRIAHETDLLLSGKKIVRTINFHHIKTTHI